MIVIHAFIRELLTPLLLGMLAASIIAGLLGGAIFLFAAIFDGQWRSLFNRSRSAE